MTDLIERAKASLEGTTEGPWRVSHAGNVHYGVSHGEYSFPTVVKARCEYDGFGNGSSRADANFIAEARTLVPELIAEVERLRANAKASRQIASLKHWNP